jgi:hypothetical protein
MLLSFSSNFSWKLWGVFFSYHLLIPLSSCNTLCTVEYHWQATNTGPFLPHDGKAQSVLAAQTGYFTVHNAFLM